MPIQVKIEKGPGLTEFLLKGGILTQESVTRRFTFVHPTIGWMEKVIFLTHIGEDRAYALENNEFTFIAYRMGDLEDKNRDDRYYFVGKYDTSSRKGTCEMMTEKEFFTWPLIGKILFPTAAKIFLRSQRSNSGRKLIKVCVNCSSAVHQSKFENVLTFCCDDAVQSSMRIADLVITDDPTYELIQTLKPKAHVALYGVTMNSCRDGSYTELRPEKPELELQILIERLSRGEPANKAGTWYVS